jgi:predicted acyltransferase
MALALLLSTFYHIIKGYWTGSLILLSSEICFFCLSPCSIGISMYMDGKMFILLSVYGRNFSVIFLITDMANTMKI